MTTDKLTALTATQARELIGTGDISAVELLQACIERIETANPMVNAVTTTCFRRARDEAKAAERQVRSGGELGPLHGLPLAVKDLEDTADVLTTRGSPLLRSNVPVADAPMVARLRAAGAVMIGKTNVPEWGAGANSRNPVWGATGNPFDPARNAGGSSGGSAAALACDMVPLATGGDTGGSLRIPAALCGVVGFRPSPGLVPSERRSLGWAPISVLGPMGRTVGDARIMLTSIVGADPRDPLSMLSRGGVDFPAEPVDLSDIRVAYAEDLGICQVDPSIRSAFRDRIAAISPLVAGCHDITGELAAIMADADRCFDVIRAINFVQGFGEIFRRDPASLGPNVRANCEIGAAMSLADVAWAQGEQTRIFRRFNELFRDVDIVLCPVTPVSPFPWTSLYATDIDGRPTRNYYHWLALTYLITLTTNPALSLPCGLDDAGMPFGLQVVGAAGGDGRLLAIAEAMEQAFVGNPAMQRPVPDCTRLVQPDPALRSIVTDPPPRNLVRDSAE